MFSILVLKLDEQNSTIDRYRKQMDDLVSGTLTPSALRKNKDR